MISKINHELDYKNDNHIVVEENNHAQLCIENKFPSSLHIDLLPKSKLSLFILSSNSIDDIANISINITDDAKLNIFDVGLKEDKSKINLSIVLAKPQSLVNYFGLQHLLGSAHKKTDILIEHKSDHTYSNQSLRGVYYEHAKSNLTSKVVIHKNCFKSEANQLFKSILLSNKAKSIIKPELEIYNNDIKASHGATMGKLDDNAIFYLCSRGLSKKEAKGMLLSSFLSSIYDHIKEEDLKKRYIALIQNDLSKIVDGKIL